MTAVKNKNTRAVAKPSSRSAVKTIVKSKACANSIRYKIVTRIQGTNEVYEATAEIPGFRPTKVSRSDGGTVFTTRSALTKACRDRASALKRNPVFDLGTPVASKSSPKAKKVSTFSPMSSVCPVTGASA